MTRRVAVMTTSYPAFAGDPSGHFVETEARALAHGGAEVTVIAPGAAADAGTVGEPANLRVERIGGGELFGWPGVLARVAERPARLARLPPWLFRARRAIAQSRADELVAHWVLPSIVPLAVGLRLPVDAITAVSHGSDVRLLLRAPAAVRTRLVRAIAAQVGRWRFVSQPLHDELSRALDADTARRVARLAFVAASPIELPDVATRARELRAEISEETLYVVAARLVPAKRVDACLTWAARAAERAPPGIRDGSARLVVLGDGPARDALTDQAQHLALAAPRLRVELLGTRGRGETLAWIAAADALLHASREEGLATVLREAAHYGTQVIAVP